MSGRCGLIRSGCLWSLVMALFAGQDAAAQFFWNSGCGSTDWYGACFVADACGPDLFGCQNNWFPTPACGLSCPQPFPGPGDAVVISTGGGVSLMGAATIASLSCQRPFTLTGTLTVNGIATFTNNVAFNSGGMLGSGVTTIAAGAVLTIGGATTKTVQDRCVNNDALTVWSGSGTLDLSNSAEFVNFGLFFVEGDAVMIYSVGTPTLFDNVGSFIKQNSSGVTLIQGVTFDNGGFVDIESGTLRLATTGTCAGTAGFLLANGTTLELNGSYTFEGGASVSGPGTLLVNGATLTLAGDSIVDVMTFSNGIVTGPGTLSCEAGLVWTGGVMSGSGQTLISFGAVANLAGSGVKSVNGRTITNDSLVHWSGDGAIDLSNGAVFDNYLMFVAENDATLIHTSGAPATFNNFGAFGKSDSLGLTLVQGVVFNNDGLVGLDSGTLRLATTGASTGEFLLGPGTTLELTGSYTFNSETVVGGEGTLRINNATLTVPADVSARYVDFVTGVLTGNGIFTCAESLLWTGGSMSGTGQTRIPFGATGNISGGNLKTATMRTISNEGVTVWQDAGNLSLNNGAIFQNVGLFDAQNNATMIFTAGAPAAFVNTGTFRKCDSSGITRVQDVVFNNVGMVEIETGTLQLATTGTSIGAFALASDTLLEMSSGSHTFNAGAAVTGAGTLRLSNATLTVAADVSASNVAITAGNLTGNGTLTCNQSLLWTAGTMTGMGQTRVAAGAMGTISSGFLKTAQVRTITNQGTTTWLDAGNLDLSNGATFDNAGTFQAANDAVLNFSFGNPATLNNAGTFRKLLSFGVTHVLGVVFNNPGLVDLQTGTLRLSSNGSSSGQYMLGGNTTLELQSGTHTFNAGADVTGPGTLLISGATLNVASDASADTVVLSNGNLSGVANFTCDQSLTWTGGQMTSSGQTIIPAAATLTISGGNLKSMNVRKLSNMGTATWEDPNTISMGNGAMITNSGTFDVENAGFIVFTGGPMSSVTNSGLFRKLSAGLTQLQGVPFTNSGEVDVQMGTLSVLASYTQTGGITKVAAGASLGSSQPIQFQGGVLRGSGTVSGNVNNPGAAVEPGDSPGTLTITGDYTQSAGGTLSIEIAGTAPGTFDRLAVGDVATLSGALNVNIGFVPDVGAEFVILMAGSVLGAFTSVNVPAGMEVEYSASQVRLVVNAPPPPSPLASANPASDNPFLAGTQPFLDVLDTGLGPTVTAGIGGAGTAPQGPVVYSPISVTFSAGPSPTPAPGNISVMCTGGVCPNVTSVSGAGAGPYSISLSAPIPPGQCTTLTFAGTAANQKLQYRSQPGNVSMDALTNTQDLLALIQALNNGQANMAANFARYNINRNVGPNPVNTQDLLRLIQLLNGTLTTQAFNGAGVAACP